MRSVRPRANPRTGFRGWIFVPKWARHASKCMRPAPQSKKYTFGTTCSYLPEGGGMKGRFELPSVSSSAACSLAKFQHAVVEGNIISVRPDLSRPNYSSRANQRETFPPSSARDTPARIDPKESAIIRIQSSSHANKKAPAPSGWPTQSPRYPRHNVHTSVDVCVMKWANSKEGTRGSFL
jgi:hypothetical protein